MLGEHVGHSLGRCISVEAIDGRRYDAIQLVEIEERRLTVRDLDLVRANQLSKLSLRYLGLDTNLGEACNRNNSRTFSNRII